MNNIPTYTLYGEQGHDNEPDWLHWETVLSRSRLHAGTLDAQSPPLMIPGLKLIGWLSALKCLSLAARLFHSISSFSTAWIR